jgi:sensor c-di-GMP phosphodiesterase-like protein
MCEAVIRLASSLGLDLVAEGVEREEQRDFLLARGARCCQGYLYSAPLPAAELADYALRWGIGDPDAHALLTDNR